MAYATIIGINPVFGLLTAFIPTIIGAFFGSAKLMVTGPTNPTALVTASVLFVFANQENYIEYVFAIAIAAGIIKLILGLFKMGDIMRFISNSVLIGFLTATSLLIMFSQAGNITGISIPRELTTIDRLIFILKNLSHTNLRVLLLFILALLTMVVTPRITRKLPAGLVTILLTTTISAIFHLENHGVALVKDLGIIKSANLAFHIPQIGFSDFFEILQGAGAIAIISIAETLTISKSLSLSTNSKVNFSKELIGQGLASTIGGFFQCIPSSGSPSRSAANLTSGAKTGGAAIISGILILLVLVLSTDLIAIVPLAGLAGVVVVAAASLINKHQLELTWHSRFVSQLVLVTTFLATIFLPLHYAIYGGTVLSILIHLYESSHLQLSYLSINTQGEIIETGKKEVLKNAEPIIILNVTGDLFFGAIADLEKTIDTILATDKKVIILRLRRVKLLAGSGVTALEWAILKAQRKGVHILFCGINPDLLKILDSSGLTKKAGRNQVFIAEDILFESMRQAISKAQQLISQPPD